MGFEKIVWTGALLGVCAAAAEATPVRAQVPPRAGPATGAAVSVSVATGTARGEEPPAMSHEHARALGLKPGEYVTPEEAAHRALLKEIAGLYPAGHERDAVTWVVDRDPKLSQAMSAELAAAKRAAASGDPQFAGPVARSWSERARRELAEACGKLAATGAPATDAERAKAYEQLEGWAASLKQAKEPGPLSKDDARLRELCRAETVRKENAKPAADPRRLPVTAPPSPAVRPGAEVQPPAAKPADKPGDPRASQPKPAPGAGEWKGYVGAGVGAAALGAAGMLLLGPVGLVGGLLLGGLLGWGAAGKL